MPDLKRAPLSEPKRRPLAPRTDALDQTPLPKGLDRGGLRLPDVPGPGHIIGPCRLIEQIGQGGTCVVFLGAHVRLDVPLAVKVVPRDVREQDPTAVRGLRTEARVLARINHPNVVRIWDFDDAGPYPYLVLEYVDGRSLGSLLRTDGRLPVKVALRMAREVVAGLVAAHARGIIHRDIKPDNLLLTSTGDVRVADFGLALAAGTRPNLASAGPLGTAAYLAPELNSSSAIVDHRADIYSLGVTLYHAVTGRLPFDGRSRMQVILQHLREAPAAPDRLVPDVARPAAELILRMMAKSPDDRFATYADLDAALRNALP
jgi:serine/threonine protein kinase